MYPEFVKSNKADSFIKTVKRHYPIPQSAVNRHRRSPLLINRVEPSVLEAVAVVEPQSADAVMELSLNPNVVFVAVANQWRGAVWIRFYITVDGGKVYVRREV